MSKALVSAVFILLLSASGAWAKSFPVLENFYVNSDAEKFINKENVSFGYRPLSNEGFLKKARFETNISYDSEKAYQSPSSTTNVKSDFIYEAGNNSSFKPFIGFGANVSYTEVSKSLTMNFGNESSQTYHVMTGFSYEPEKHPAMSIKVGYSYSDSLNEQARSTPVSYDVEPNGHGVSVFVSFRF
jgi:opacity protein-like surface antigen